MDNNVNRDKFKSSQLAKDIYDQFEMYKADRGSWVKQAAEDNDFFLGKHYTANELLEMKLKGMAPVVVDKVNPIIMQEVAIFTATRPAYRALPRGDGDVKLAGLWSDVLAWMWYDSSCDSEYLQCITSYFSIGAGYMFVGVDPYGEDGDGRIFTINLPVWDVYPDPFSRKIDLSDARAIFVSRVIPRSSLKFAYPDQSNKINNASEEFGPVEDKPIANSLPEDGSSGFGFSQNDYSFTDMNDDLVRVTEMYEKMRVPHWKVFDGKTGEINVYRADQFNPKTDTFPGQRYMKIWRTRIRVTAILGNNVMLYRTILPTDTYPVVPFYLHHNGTPWVRGDISIMKGQQRALNKSRSISMHNASQMSNFRWVAPRGSIHDRENWEERGAAAGNILEYTQGFDKPEAVMPGQLPAAWFTLEQAEKQDIEYSVGVFGNMMGNAADAPETYRSVLALEESGVRRIKHKIQHANHSLRLLGRVQMQYAQSLYTMPKVMRIAGENQTAYKEIYLNQLGIDPITKKQKKFNDISIGTYDLVVHDGTAMPTNRMALLQVYMELYQMGLVDQEEVLKKTDVVNQDELIKRMGQVQQLTAKMNQMEEVMKDTEGLNQTLRRQLMQQQVKNTSMQAGMGIERELDQTKIEQRLLKARMGDALKNFQKELALEKQKIKAQGAAAGAMFKVNERAAIDGAKSKAKGKDNA